MGTVSKFILVNLAGILFSATLTCCCIAAQTGNQQDLPGESLRRFLQAWNDEISAQYSAAFQDVNDDGIPEAFVYLTGGRWCGSGGCSLLVLKQAGSSWQVVTRTTITRLPIRMLTKKSNGWHNISVWVEGGGIQPGYEAELIFDGKTYPTNPTVPPARQIKKELAGVVVIPLPDDGATLR